MSTLPPDGSNNPPTPPAPPVPAPAPAPKPGFLRRNRVYFAVFGAVLFCACGYFVYQRLRVPNPGDSRYEEYVEAFEIGTAALDMGVTEISEDKLSRAIRLVPQEPSGWANRGLSRLKAGGQLKEADADLREAERRAPDDPDIMKIRGLLEEKRGKFDAAIENFRKAAKKDPHDIESAYHLASLLEQHGMPGFEEEYQRLVEQILAVRPTNRHATRMRLLTAVKLKNPAVAVVLAQLRPEKSTWINKGNDNIQEWFTTLDNAYAAGDWGKVTDAARSFTNLYMGQPGYQLDSTELDPRGGYVGHPLHTFRRLAPMHPSPSPPDTELTLTAEPLTDAPAGKWDVAVPVWLTGDGNPIVVVANDKELRRTGNPAALATFRLAPDGVIPIDWNNDYHTDLIVFGREGARFYEQDKNGNFTNANGKTKLPAEVLNGDYAAALVADTDLDGDLDIVLGRRTGPPLLLRNNFDGTFTAQPIFPEVEGARAFAWADLDHDGAPDAVVLDSMGKLHVYANERSGYFRKWPVALPEGTFIALAVADADDDGALDLIALRTDGAILRISDRNKRQKWDVAELAKWDGLGAGAAPGSVRLFVADLDNNGVPDLIASGATASAAWLGAGDGKFERLSATVPPRVGAVADLTTSGRIDLLALDPEGKPVRYRNSGKKDYHWLTIRFRTKETAEQPNGDERVNSFGIGGELEFRTGTHVVKAPITNPVVHAGLGTRKKCAVLRVKWPNGGAQVEFPKEIDQSVVTEQRLKSSCPFLFSWNGEKFVFVTDFMWSTPLGMYINAQDKGGFLQTTEWVKVRGDQLVPKDNYYELRVNANLWETHYFDHLALRVVDHPPDTELFVDERFALEPMKPAYHLVSQTKPVAKAWDHRGADATAEVRAIDGVYLDRAGRGLYQGITNDHWVEVDLGDDAPKEGPVWLVAHGWIHPTDSSINFALEQGTNARPRALVLEVPDGTGGWKVARDKIGFPAGKNKTIVLRLDGLDGPGVARRFRLRTNMEIFWDALHYARGLPDTKVTEKELLPEVADLRFRGVVAMSQANKSSPELPDYDRVVSTRQVWRDLIGYHTRFGDIRELLAKTDDRYAILTAGDEVVLRFAVPPAPPPGWKRDFVWVSDGWVKDGDLNTRFGKTVLPLPSHDMKSYDVAPTTLETDPVYRRFRKDWDVFHTRYVIPDEYERGLRAFKRRGEK